jgi:YebC/PmpR family DNA-binding regulatory protein
MSGHSKWNNIKNRKGAADAQKARVFTQLAKAIRVAVQEGKSGDPKFNPTLRLMLDKARTANMTKDKIQRAIDAGLGKRDGQSIQEIVYEGFGPGGVGLLIVAMTDNTQRTSSELKFILSRGGGSLGSPGSVQYMFSRSSDGSDYQASMPFEVADPETVEKLVNLIDQLREQTDVEDVYAAATWPDMETDQA